NGKGMKHSASLIPVLFLLILINNFLTPKNHINPDKSLKNDPHQISIYEKYEMTVVSISDTFDFVFIPKNAKSIKSVAKKGNFKIMINGSFFSGTRLTARHAGWLRLFGKTFSPIGQDRQVSHIFRYNLDEKKSELIPYQKFIPTDDNRSIEFQTGPLVVDSNKVAQKYIAESINGLSKHVRTLLAITDKRHFHFITVRERVSLDELGNYLTSLAIFANQRLDVVNLDGGPSVALYVEKYPELNYNADARLPILLGAK
ncbi:phosphodiester glycosidase family protein, partial [candidate division KSB1 bacterium]|nr:phosphodiester glycosidase family protein [candidate division KSB1 bacterium]